MSIQQLLLSGSDFVATGGTITDVGLYRYHTFTASSDFTVVSGMRQCDYLIISGGGTGAGYVSGSGGIGGGGGAGDYIEILNEFIGVGIYPVVVAGKATGPSNGSLNGYNSSFNGLTAIGGGGGDSKSGASGGGARGHLRQPMFPEGRRPEPLVMPEGIISQPDGALQVVAVLGL